MESCEEIHYANSTPVSPAQSNPLQGDPTDCRSKSALSSRGPARLLSALCRQVAQCAPVESEKGFDDVRPVSSSSWGVSVVS